MKYTPAQCMGDSQSYLTKKLKFHQIWNGVKEKHMGEKKYWATP